MRITLRQLEIFEAVARNLNFTRAADELHLSQPAVSLQVKQLEATLDVSLFDIVGRKVLLTTEGELVLAHCKVIHEDVESLFDAVKQAKQGGRGRLRIAVASTVNYFAARVIASFHRLYPDIEVSLDVTNRQSLITNLEQNIPDIVLMGTPPRDLDVNSEEFMENPLVVIASIDHRHANKTSISLRDLSEDNFLVREYGSGTRVAMERFFQEKEFEPRNLIEMRGNEAIKQSVEAGLGVAVVSRHTVTLELDVERLCVLSVLQTPIRRKWFLVSHAGRPLSKPAELFREHVLNSCDSENQRNAG